MKRLIIIIFVLCFSLIFSAQVKNKKVSLPLTFDSYYSYEELVEALQLLNKNYPQLTKLEVAGLSDENRKIYCLTINNEKTGPAEDKPAVYVDANIHGNEIQGAEVCLYLAQYLLQNYNQNQEVQKVLDTTVFYLIPSVNVDGRWHFFNDPGTPSSNRTLRRPKDDDNDGLIDEDGPDDLDGDGNICMMRKKDPLGRYKTDSSDPRLMVAVKPGEEGEWAILGMEGIDNDGDGLINEDGDGYVDGNRTFPFNWMPPYIQKGADDFPLAAKTTKSLTDFIETKKNIVIVWALHNYGGMILRGPSNPQQMEYPRQDLEVYDFLGKEAEKIIPGYRYLISYKDLYTTYGDFTEFMTMLKGAYGFVGELYRTEQETFRSEKETQEKKPKTDEAEEYSFFDRDDSEAERLLFNDHLTQKELYKEWKAYKHPLYGDIEIGGWVKFSTRLPHPFMLPDLVHRNAMAILFTAKQVPRITMEINEVRKEESGFYRVKVTLRNIGNIPTMSQLAIQNRLYPKDQLLVKAENNRVIASAEIINRFTQEASYKTDRPEIQFLSIPARQEKIFIFLLEKPGKITIQYKSDHARNLTKNIDLQ